MSEPTVDLKLGVSAVNVILSALAELPYRMSADLIRFVKEQADSQIAAQTKPESNDTQSAT